MSSSQGNDKHLRWWVTLKAPVDHYAMHALNYEMMLHKNGHSLFAN